MLILLQFVVRLSFGMAMAVAFVPAGDVDSGFFRNKHYVLLGLNALASIVAWSVGDVAWWPEAAAAVLSYAGAVCWLYQKPRAGVTAVNLVAVMSLVAAWQTAPISPSDAPVVRLVDWIAPISGGLLLGSAMTAMLLGHWYLNSPGMKLAPLRRLIGLLAGATLLQAVVSGWALGLLWTGVGAPDVSQWLFVSLRWLGGIGGTGLLAYMAWQTLKIPNTQSATGILYVAVITTFLGELVSLLLARQTGFPL